MALKIGASARKERGLIPEETTVAEKVVEVKEPVVQRTSSDVVLEQLEGTRLMGILKHADGTRSVVELNILDGKPTLVVSKPADAKEAAYQFKIAISHRILKG